ncbi:ATP-binding protein [Pengzhenrongella phosphoraccumulans]|uniref:ATP-binding protein n=1 Tax=Pengzhenrongella phosphoraccumulans TaxID=3114394 RepID=UPI00388ED242
MTHPMEGFDPALAQFRLATIQLVNWGPFHGYHSIDIHRDGTLVTGPSGSGKSTLLDAISCVLMDRSVTFNAAAHDDGVGSKERTFYSYVRGKSGARRDASRGSKAIYLREGATWSAVGLTWENKAGASITGCRAMQMSRAATGDGEITHSLLITEQPFDLRDLEPAADQHLRQDAVRRAVPTAATFGNEYGRYIARLSTLIGIRGQDGDSAKAIRLLHKAQSSKGVHNIDETFKRFVLDDSQVTDRKDTAVEQFQSLRNGYDDMTRARDQIGALGDLPELWEGFLTAGGSSAELRALIETDAQVTPLESYVLRLHKDLLAARAEYEHAERTHQRTLHGAATAEYGRLAGKIKALEAHRHEQGGDALDRLDAQRGVLVAERARTVEQAQDAAARCDLLGVPAPGSPKELAVLLAQHPTSGADDDEPSLRATLHASIAAHSEAGRTLTARRSDLASFASRRSNIPVRALELRRRIIEGTGLVEADLPFVGELIDVASSEEVWRPAAERLLGGFGLGLLVARGSYAQVAQFVDTHDLRGRVRYTPVDTGERPAGAPGAVGTMAAKIDVADSPFAGWVTDQLVHRFAHTCAQEASELAHLPQAVTLRGQIKHRGGTHEKDDRDGAHRDRVIGFDNAATVRDLEQEISALELHRDELAIAVGQADAARELVGRRRDAWARLASVTWDEIDVAAADRALAQLDAEAASSASGDALVGLDEQLGQLTEARDEANHQARTALAASTEAERRWSARLTEEDAVTTRLDAAPELAADELRVLAEIAASCNPNPEVEGVGALRKAMVQAVEARLATVRLAETNARGRIQLMLANFLHRWPDEAGELSPEVDSAPDYLARLKYLLEDDLPGALDDWRRLMHRINQMGLSSLIQTLRDERHMIDDRISPVNDVLRHVPFGYDGYLQIATSDVEPPASRAFKAEIDAILETTPGKDLDDAGLEERFRRIQRLMVRLDGTEPADREWQRDVLDVKRHVRIAAEEYRRGETSARVYEGVGATSGGEGQELIAATLGAALRYQLGGIEEVPVFGSVTVDEGFVKSDPDVTRRAIRALQSFGFQLLIAAPLDKYQSMEREFGSAYLIESDPNLGRAQAKGFAIGFGPDRPGHEPAVRTTDLP